MLSGAGWAVEFKMPRWRSDGFGAGRGMGTAPEDGGPGGRVAGTGRSFGAVTGLVVKGVAVAGQVRGRGWGALPSRVAELKQPLQEDLEDTVG